MDAAEAGVFNHVAVTVPWETLQEPTRSKLVFFYSQVFGWELSPHELSERHMVLRAYRRGQYVNLTASRESSSQMRPGDHVGLQVGSFERLRTIAAAARKWKDERDGGVQISRLGRTPSEQGPVYSVFVQYLLPLQVEVQYYAGLQEPAYALD
jgi:hypothetical protein